MRVKRLEIQGFKSFKDKTVIHFDHTITGIVGPNGCGKSNIVDAFFWVMGEQSYKHMRGTGADDLIFNGSSRYSPLGMAEATMVLEQMVPDTENGPAGASAEDTGPALKAKEIAVTRRVYRDGNGEYFVNGVPARLKDIQELFMDTGVGAKGYSVIEQGQIGKIVNAKPEERRLLIEEAAGIAKYKARKKESLRKIEATQANLSRLNDVIAEIERSLNSLERQAQKARQYKKYKEELFEKEITWGRRKARVLNQQLQEVKSRRDLLEQDLVTFRAELQVVENTIEIDRVHSVTEGKFAEEIQARIQENSGELTRQKAALDLSQRRQKDLEATLASLQSEKEELVEGIAISQETLAQFEIEFQTADETQAQAQAQVQDQDEATRQLRSEAQQARGQVEQLKREQLRSVSDGSSLTSSAASLASRAESALAQAQRLAQQIEEQEARLAESRIETEAAQERASIARTQKEEQKGLREDSQVKLRQQEQAQRDAQKARDEATKVLTQTRTKLSSLKELDAAYEGFGDGPKAALDWARSNGQGQLRAVADAIDVQSGYEQALEGWLEDRLQNLISGDPSFAIEALAELASQNQGRASIHVVPEPARGTTDFGGISSALEASGFEVLGDLGRFVRIRKETGETVSAIALQLISHVCVVKSLQPITAFLKQNQIHKLGGWSIVALDGSAFDSYGILRGGSTESSKPASVLGRKRIIADLETEAQALEEQLAQREAAFEEAQSQLEAARTTLEEANARIQALDVELATSERDAHQMGKALREAEGQLERSRQESRRATEEAEEAGAKRADIESRLVELNETRAELEIRIQEAESRSQEIAEKLQVAEQELSNARIQEASVRERTGSLQRELQAKRSVISDRQRRLNEVERQLGNASNEQQNFNGGDQGLQEKIEELILKLAEDQDSLSSAKDRLEQVNARLKQNLDRIKELHAGGNEKTSQSAQLAVDVERVSGELAHLKQNLEEKYGPECLNEPQGVPIQEEMDNPVVTTEMTAEEAQALSEEVERLRERIRRLGDVNPDADQEYERVKERYDHLLGEKADLVTSMKNLEEAIEHINRTSEERFRKAYEAIADRFQRLFPIIFGGGMAKLDLVYPEGSNDILEAGVDIMAMPPGKKVSSITLLSGGEKALTAVSLIFAIFMVKPSPFCVLDEVDAPLDDANIGKFNALLKEMSAKSQFILITHNKKTMELNDTLYGVTMEEPGVSKMVSIEMR